MKNDKDQDTQIKTDEKSTGVGEMPEGKSEGEKADAAGGDGGSAGEMLSGAVDTIKESAQDIVSKARGVAGDAYEKASETAVSKLDEQKGTLTSGLTGVADSLRQVGSTLREGEEKNPITDITGQYGDKLAGGIESVSAYFEERDLGEIVSDVEDFARKNPAVFIGGAFVLGLLAARFLKSSGASASQMVSEVGSQGGRGAKKRNSKKAKSSNDYSNGDGESDESAALGETSGASNRNTSSTKESVDNPM